MSHIDLKRERFAIYVPELSPELLVKLWPVPTPRKSAILTPQVKDGVFGLVWFGGLFFD